MIRFGEENDDIGEKMHRLSLALLKARSMEALLYVLENNLREDFEVPHVALRVWGMDSSADLPEFSPVGASEIEIAESLTQPRCGHHIASELLSWFGEAGEHLRSFALVPLYGEKAMGMLVLASEDPQRFAPDIGTLHLKRLGEWVAAALSRF